MDDCYPSPHMGKDAVRPHGVQIWSSLYIFQQATLHLALNQGAVSSRVCFALLMRC